MACDTDYAPVGRSWSVLSGTLGDKMIYEKAMFTCGGAVISSFALVYPIAEREFYDSIVEDIEDSFRPGAWPVIAMPLLSEIPWQPVRPKRRWAPWAIVVATGSIGVLALFSRRVRARSASNQAISRDLDRQGRTA